MNEGVKCSHCRGLSFQDLYYTVDVDTIRIGLTQRYDSYLVQVLIRRGSICIKDNGR